MPEACTMISGPPLKVSKMLVGEGSTWSPDRCLWRVPMRKELSRREMFRAISAQSKRGDSMPRKMGISPKRRFMSMRATVFPGSAAKKVCCEVNRHRCRSYPTLTSQNIDDGSFLPRLSPWVFYLRKAWRPGTSRRAFPTSSLFKGRRKEFLRTKLEGLDQDSRDRPRSRRERCGQRLPMRVTC